MNIELLNKILSLSLLVDEPAHCCGSELGKVNKVGVSWLVEACGIHSSRLPAWKRRCVFPHFPADNRKPCIPKESESD